MSNKQRTLLIVSGLIPLFGLFGKPPDPMLLIYTTFVVVVLLRSRIEAWVGKMPGSDTVHLVGSFLIAGSLTEALAWLNNYWKAPPEPALFHPQLFADLILGIGFYGGWAAAWWIVLRWFRFSLCEAFLVTGIQGIWFEQIGAVFKLMLQIFKINPAQSLLIGLYVVAVHGSATGLGLAPVLSRFNSPEKSRSWVRFPLVIILMVGLAYVGSWLITMVTQIFGGLPPKRSIVEHPFW